MTSSEHAKAPAVDPAVSAAGDEGLNPTIHQIEGVNTMMTRLTARSATTDYREDLGTWSHPVPLNDVRIAHTAAHAKLHGPIVRTWPGIGAGVTNVTFEDGYAIYYRETPVDEHPDEYFREDPITVMCPLRSCDETFTSIPGDAEEWLYQHSHTHKAMADTLKIETLAGFNVVDETAADEGGGGVGGALELLTDHGMFGEPTTSRHYISISKARGALNDPGIPAYMLPELIDQLQRLHAEYLRQIEASQ